MSDIIDVVRKNYLNAYNWQYKLRSRSIIEVQ